MNLYDDNSTQTLYKRARVVGDEESSADAEWEGDASLYDPPAGEDAEAFVCIYEPGYSDRGRDLPEIRAGRILTTTELALRDLIFTAPDGEMEEGQEVTGVNEQFDFDGSLYGYEVFF